MDFDGVNSIVCDAEEADWLDVSYSERNYVQSQPTKASKKGASRFKGGKALKVAAIALLCAALLAALLFVDGQFAKDVFNTAKAAYSATVFDNSTQQQVSTASIAIPSNADLLGVEDGLATFGGGKAAVSFSAGQVVAATEDSVTVALNDTTKVVYGNLTTVFVNAGDNVSANTLLAKYQGQFTVAVSVADAVVDVIADETQLTWSV